MKYLHTYCLDQKLWKFTLNKCVYKFILQIAIGLENALFFVLQQILFQHLIVNFLIDFLRFANKVFIR